MSHSIYRQLLTLPNLLTCFRFISVPFLLWLAWNQYQQAFLILLAVTFFSDVLDGMAARLLHQQSELGAKLDSWGDLMVYSTIAISTWWLHPELIVRENLYVVIVVGSYLLPVMVGFIKFKAFTSYHTWLVKLAAALMGASYFVLMWFDMDLPFKISAVICLIAAMEEIAITLQLEHLKSNVKSLWHIRQVQD